MDISTVKEDVNDNLVEIAQYLFELVYDNNNIPQEILLHYARI
jgi:hypothetical protein